MPSRQCGLTDVVIIDEQAIYKISSDRPVVPGRDITVAGWPRGPGVLVLFSLRRRQPEIIVPPVKGGTITDE